VKQASRRDPARLPRRIFCVFDGVVFKRLFQFGPGWSIAATKNWFRQNESIWTHRGRSVRVAA
jgi:hypothetical protein